MNFDPSQMTADDFDQRIAQLEQETARMHAAYWRKKKELDWWREGRDVWVTDNDETEDDAEAAASTNGKVDQPEVAFEIVTRKPPLRQAVAAVMREGMADEWRALEVIAALRKRGWMPEGKNAEHTVRGMVAEMAKKGQLKRVAYGVYALSDGEEGGAMG
jgi:hypothetical protein